MRKLRLVQFRDRNPKSKIEEGVPPIPILEGLYWQVGQVPKDKDDLSQTCGRPNRICPNLASEVLPQPH